MGRAFEFYLANKCRFISYIWTEKPYGFNKKVEEMEIGHLKTVLEGAKQPKDTGLLDI